MSVPSFALAGSMRRESPMRTRIRTIGILCTILGTSVLYSADFSVYRGFRFGMNVADAVKKLGTPVADVKVIHQRPALIQEIAWQRRDSLLANSPSTDPATEGLLCFFDGELFRMIVSYDRYKIEGMTADDLIEGISATYGTATRPVAEIPYHSNYAEVAKVLARWEDPGYSYNLVRTGDQSSFAMVLCSKRLDMLAQAAIVEAGRLDAREAPEREIQKEKDQADAERQVREKARSVNKPNFRP
jgi:hypothetical protein